MKKFIDDYFVTKTGDVFSKKFVKNRVYGEVV